MEELNNTTNTAPSAAPENPTPTPAVTPPAAEVVSGCTGNCKRCHPLQQSYCSAQIGYNMQNVLAGLIARMSEMQEQVGRLADEVTLLSKQSEEPPAIIEAPTPEEQPKKAPKKPAKN